LRDDMAKLNNRTTEKTPTLLTKNTLNTAKIAISKMHYNYVSAFHTSKRDLRRKPESYQCL